MKDDNSYEQSRWRIESGFLRPRSIILEPVKRKRFKPIRKHPWISLIAAGIFAYAASNFIPPIEIKIGYEADKSPQIKLYAEVPEPYFPAEEDSPLEAAVEFKLPNLNDEQDWEECPSNKKELFAKYQIFSKEDYEDLREGRSYIDISEE